MYNIFVCYNKIKRDTYRLSCMASFLFYLVAGARQHHMFAGDETVILEDSYGLV